MNCLYKACKITQSESATPVSGNPRRDISVPKCGSDFPVAIIAVCPM